MNPTLSRPPVDSAPVVLEHTSPVTVDEDDDDDDDGSVPDPEVSTPVEDSAAPKVG